LDVHALFDRELRARDVVAQPFVLLDARRRLGVERELRRREEADRAARSVDGQRHERKAFVCRVLLVGAGQRLVFVRDAAASRDRRLERLERGADRAGDRDLLPILRPPLPHAFPDHPPPRATCTRGKRAYTSAASSNAITTYPRSQRRQLRLRDSIGFADSIGYA